MKIDTVIICALGFIAVLLILDGYQIQTLQDALHHCEAKLETKK